MKCRCSVIAVLLAGTANCFAQQSAMPNDTLPTLSKNHIIRSLQTRVADRPDCVRFKQQLQAVGQAVDGGNNANFTQDVRKIVLDIRSSGCIAQQDYVSAY